MGQGQSSDSGGNACLTKSEETTLECVVKSQDSDRSAVEEKLKEVICKTVVNIPLTDGKPGDEAIVTNLVPESSSSCLDYDGKLLVKVIKAHGLTGIDKSDIPDAYCVVTSKEPSQKKKTKTIKETKDPIWNETHILDVGQKTKEIAFDIYNELKTSEESGFLGQVIVPLAMIGKDQSCRLILPILPTSTKNSYVSGQINLEVAHIYRREYIILKYPREIPFMGYSIGFYQRSKFTYDKDGKAFETSTEPTSSKPNATSDEKPKTAQHKTKVEEARPGSPQRLVFSMATLDIIDDDDGQLEFLPLVDHGIGREDIVTAEQKIEERSAHGGYETDPILIQENERHHEMLQELIELDQRATPGVCSTTEENQKKKEPAKKTQRPSSRHSQHSQQASPSTSPVQTPGIIEIFPEERGETSNNQEMTTDNVEGVPLSPKEETKPPTIDENLMEDLTPNTRRKVFRKAFSMRISRDSETPSEKIETDVQQTRNPEIEKRHSFSGGEKVQPRTKSGSDVSLNSLYDSTKSVLVVETRDRDQIKYYQIPPLMARRGTFDHKGTKLHICNDHLFVATHFSGTLPTCSVCNVPLTGYFGKQGYECRDCNMITHKRCHYEASTACTNSTLSSLRIKKAASIHGYK